MIQDASVSESAERNQLIYRWDLDKTYLRTEFDTFKDLLRTAFEPATRKKTVPGAGVLLREIRATDPAGIFILSGSPEQMRRVLEAKLRLDGIRWDSFTLKPSLRNLLRGKVRFLRDQLSYKLASLVESRTRLAPGTQEVLFGDDAEADAYIYSLYADLCAGRVSTTVLMDVLRRSRVYAEDIAPLVRMTHRLPQQEETVRRIFIHLDRMSGPERFSAFGMRLCPFYNYFQPALVMFEDRWIDADAAMRVGVEIVTEHGFGAEALIASFRDLAKRGYIGRECATRLLAEASRGDESSMVENLRQGFFEALEGLLPELEERRPILPEVGNYATLFDEDQAWAHAARQRVSRR